MLIIIIIKHSNRPLKSLQAVTDVIVVCKSPSFAQFIASSDIGEIKIKLIKQCIMGQALVLEHPGDSVTAVTLLALT